jgi:hypothetical protein
MSKNGKPVKAGHYYAAKYHGDNGDLIVGRVESVRSSGVVILTNLISGNRSTKDIDVLSKRNVRVSKTEADEILDVFKTKGKASARELAVKITMPPASPDQTIAPRTVKKTEIKVCSECGGAQHVYFCDGLIQQPLYDKLQKSSMTQDPVALTSAEAKTLLTELHRDKRGLS